MKSLLFFLIDLFVISCNKNHCTNGVQDANETGIDCGGHCPPCDVS